MHINERKNFRYYIKKLLQIDYFSLRKELNKKWILKLNF